jgi:hypothetical protein
VPSLALKQKVKAILFPFAGGFLRALSSWKEKEVRTTFTRLRHQQRDNNVLNSYKLTRWPFHPPLTLSLTLLARAIQNRNVPMNASSPSHPSY